MTTRPDIEVARRPAIERAVLSVAELHDCGLDDQAILVRVRNGRLHPRFRGVYAVGHDKLDLEACFLAAVKACGPDAALSHYSAAVLRGWLEWDGRDPEVTAPSRRRHRGIKTHRAKHIERRTVRGIPVTTPARTLADLAGSPLPDKRLKRAVNEALNQRAITLAELVVVKQRGARRLREVIASAAPTKNEFEDAMHAILLDAGLPAPLVNQPYLGYEPDFRWPDQRVILEADGARTHDQPLARADGARRQAVLEAHGETVLRISWRQAVLDPQPTIKRLRCALACAAERSLPTSGCSRHAPV